VHADALGSLIAGLRYRLAAHVQQAEDEDSEVEAFDLDWHRRTLTAALYRDAPEQRGVHYGASVVRTDATGSGLDDGFALGTAYAGYARGWGSLVASSVLALAATGEAVGVKAAQALELEQERRALRFTLALDRRLPQEAPGYGFWRARGFTDLELPAVTYLALGPPTPQTEASARLGGRLEAAAVRVEGGAHVWVGRGLFVERPALGLSDDGTTAEGTVTALPDAEGTACGAWARATAERGRWHGTAWYSLLAPFGGSDAFRAAWGRVPRHRAGAAVALRPDAGLTLRASFEAQSATHWPAYAAVAGTPSRPGPWTTSTPTVPPPSLSSTSPWKRGCGTGARA
jgi:hypothetical protein